MEELLREIKEKLDRMEERDQRTENKLDELQKEMQAIKAVNEQLTKENRYLKIKNTQHERLIEEMNREIKKRNIIIHGLEDQEEESELQLSEKIRVVIRDMGIKIEMEKETVETRRLGKYRTGKTRPIQVEFGKWEKKMEILKGTKNLRGKNIYIEDYSKAMQEIRKQLIIHRNKIRTQGHHVLLRYNKLIINGEDFYLEQLEEIGKELESESKKEETPKEKTGGRTISERSPDEELQERLCKITKTNRGTGAIPKNLQRN